MNASTHEPAQHSVPQTPHFPPSKEPRVWFLTDGLSPIAISLSRHLLRHGDFVISGVLPSESNGTRGDELREFMEDMAQEGNLADDLGEEDDMDIDVLDVGGDGDGEGEGEGESEEVSEEGRPKAQRPAKKRWRERFKIIALDER